MKPMLSRPVRRIGHLASAHLGIMLLFALITVFLTGLAVYENALGGGNPSGIDDNSAAWRGEDELRIENEDKLNIPLENTEEVWNYLYSRYVEDVETLTALNPHFSSYFNEEHFTDTYFDTPDLQMLQQQSGVRHRRRLNLTNPDDNKSGRELMQIKLSGVSDNVLNRGEIKFNVEDSTAIKTQDDVHPMIGIVKRSERDAFKHTLAGLGVDPYTMKPVLTLEQRRRRIYILDGGRPFMSVSLDEVTSRKLWVTVRFAELEPELSEVEYTAANLETRLAMEAVSTKMVDDLLQAFPYIQRDLTPKYNKVFDQLEGELGFIRFLIRYFNS